MLWWSEGREESWYGWSEQHVASSKRGRWEWLQRQCTGHPFHASSFCKDTAMPNWDTSIFHPAPQNTNLIKLTQLHSLSNVRLLLLPPPPPLHPNSDANHTCTWNLGLISAMLTQVLCMAWRSAHDCRNLLHTCMVHQWSAFCFQDGGYDNVKHSRWWSHVFPMVRLCFHVT